MTDPRKLGGFLTFDTETTILSGFKRKADPFNLGNWVVYLGYKAAADTAVTKIKFADKQQSMGWFGRMLEEHWPAVLVGMNNKFDVLHGIAQDPWSYAVYKKWIVAGGQLWDIQLAEYLLEGMLPESQMLSLDEIAIKYGGTLKEGGDAMKELWAQGICTSSISEDIVYPYLDGDVTNTEIAFKGQALAARKVGQTKSILLNMGAQVYIIECEKNGIYVDRERGFALAAELVEEIKVLKAELETFLPEFPPELEWSWTSRTKLSALIFGGKVKYQKKVHQSDDMGKLLYAQKKVPAYLLEDGSTTLYEPGSEGAPDIMSYQVYAGGKNAGSYKTKQVSIDDHTRPKTKITDFYFDMPGYTEPEKKWEGATPGVYSTAADVIEELGYRDIPFLKALDRHAKAVKDLGTYFIVDDPKEPGGKKGMLSLMRDYDIIHHQINQTSTVTGRLSHSHPNSGNLPRPGEGKSKIKSAMKSRYSKQVVKGRKVGGKIIQSDFSSLEIYIQAILTGDRQLIDDLKNKIDMHCKRVAATYNISYEEAFDLCKVQEVPEWDERRTKAKEFSFQRAFGAGAKAIAAKTGLPLETVEELIANEIKQYPQIEKFFEGLTKRIEANKKGVRKTIPHPDFPAKMISLSTGYDRTPDNKLYAWIEQPAPEYMVKRGQAWTSFSPPEIKNYEVQGGGAEWAKAAMWLAVREYYRQDNFDGLAHLIGQVHDACYADAHDDVYVKAAATLHVAMEMASPFMEAYFGWPQPVYVPSDTTVGEDWGGHDKVPDLAAVAAPIRAEMHKLYVQPHITQ